MLSVWHAPVPWVHLHETSGPTVAYDVQLQRHLGEFHPHLAAETQPASLGWHVHLVLPWQCGHKGDCDPRQTQHGTPDCISNLQFGSAFSSPSGSQAVVELLAHTTFGLPTLVLPALLDESNPALTAKPALSAPTGFLASFAGSVAICDLIDRHLC
jgi:hypothetical protein